MFSGLGIGDIGEVFVIILISMAAHEAMHAYVAHALGDTTAQDAGRLTLNPFKHVDLVTTVLLPVIRIIAHLPPIFAARPVPFDPRQVRFGEYGAALVGIAGPLTNLILAGVGAMIIRFVGLGSALAEPIMLFVQVNISFFVFNMLPLPPLDGSRLVYAFAPEPVQEFMQRIESAGFMLTIGLLLVLSPFIMPIISNIDTALLRLLLL